MRNRVVLICGLAAIAIAIVVAAVMVTKAINAPRVITPISNTNTNPNCDNSIMSQFPVCN
jgi:hypothetical protein